MQETKENLLQYVKAFLPEKPDLNFFQELVERHLTLTEDRQEAIERIRTDLGSFSPENQELLLLSKNTYILHRYFELISEVLMERAFDRQQKLKLVEEFKETQHEN